MSFNLNYLGLILGLAAIGFSIVGMIDALIQGDYSFGENELGLVVGGLLLIFYFTGGMKRRKR